MHRRVVIIAVVLGSAGCLDREGLDPTFGDAGDAPGSAGTGGRAAGGAAGSGQGGAGAQPGSGGSGGQTGGAGPPGTGGGAGAAGGSGGGGGQMGGAGGNRPDAGADNAAMCGPVCPIVCPNGQVVDERGCLTCQCKPAPTCQPVACQLFCQHGFQKDANGCEVCKCNPPPTCRPVTCRLFCPNGFQKDANGCEICACNPSPVACTPADCGPAPGAPNQQCPDGSLAGPVCERTATGRCAWIFRECPDNCQDARNPTQCANNPTCRWLEPGCTEPKLAVAGCYPRAHIGCDRMSCPSGRQCVRRVINPCASAGAGAPLPPGLIPPPGGCAACGQEISVCL